ncbi:MAG: class I SAM-dependent methyltransferase [Thermodesulfovibrionales bacterium]|nr:class I SAM-dependent methyltransferase [Thermodesulfovibrionales bacterium]
MDNLSKEYIVDFFSKKLMLFGNTPAAVGWSAAGQRLRYECILNLLPLEGQSVLDFGCGKGDFYSFLKEKGIKVKYRGIDINLKLIETASHNHPEAEFMTSDIDSEELPEDYDYIISCGVFNLNVEGVKESIERYLRKLFEHTNKTLLFNCLGSHSKIKDINLIYLNPKDLVAAAKKITDSTAIHHDLIEGDIFLLLNKS